MNSQFGDLLRLLSLWSISLQIWFENCFLKTFELFDKKMAYLRQLVNTVTDLSTMYQKQKAVSTVSRYCLLFYFLFSTINLHNQIYFGLSGD